jgi:hypothetical protein
LRGGRHIEPLLDFSDPAFQDAHAFPETGVSSLVLAQPDMRSSARSYGFLAEPDDRVYQTTAQNPAQVSFAGFELVKTKEKIW